MTPPRRPAARPRVERLEDRATPATLSTFLTTEHVDINLGYSGGTWTLQNSDDENGVPYDTDVALLYAGEPSQTSRPGGSAFDFIGVGAGQDFYRLPQSQDPNLLYLGFAGYGAASADFDRYDPSTESKGRVSGLGRWLKVSLVGVQHTTPAGVAGAGQFSVWQSGDTGPNVFMSNYTDAVSNPDGNGLDTTDGITADDALWIVAGGHIHYNWGFTQKGRYEVTVKLSGYLNDGNTTSLGQYVESQPFTLYFSVGSVGQLEFDASTYSVNEAAGTASVTVRRVNGSDGRVTVNYATSNGSATAGSDYTAASGTLTFNDQETSKTITIPVINDSADEPDETVNLTLSSPGPSSINGYLVDVEADANGLIGGRPTATLTIVDNDDPANTPPTISNVANQATNEDTPTGAVPFTVGDAQTPPANLVVTASSSNAALVPTANIVFGGSGASRTVTITPAANATGTVTITLTVTDAGGLTATDTFVLTVNPVNDPPTISDVADQATNENAPTGAIAFTVGDDETAAGSLTLGGSSSNPALVPNANIVFGGSGANRTVAITPAPGQTGTTTITLTVTDAAGLTATDTFVLTVNPVNDPPTISSISDVVMNEDGDVTINFTVGDAETAAGSLAVTGTRTNTTLFSSVGTSASSRLRLGGSDANRTLRIRPDFNLSGESFVTLTVTDADNATSEVTFKITVSAVNDPPIASDDAAFVPVGTASALAGLLDNDPDPEDQPVTITGFTQPASGAVTQGTNGGLTYTPQAGFRGFDSFTYTIEDDQGATATATVTLSVGVVDFVHTDTYVNYLNGEWYLNIKADYEPQALVDSDEAVLFANPSARFTLPALPPEYAFLGAGEGDDVWLLPETQEVGKIWLGFSNEGTPLENLAGSIQLDLAYFSGPGHFSMFVNDAFGSPIVSMDTVDGVTSAADSAVGGNSADSFELFQRGHAHVNWAFTQPGRYVIGLRPTALVNTTDAGGNPIQVPSTGPVTYYYIDVDALTGIPLGENAPQARGDAAAATAGAGAVTVNVLGNDSSAPDPDEALAVTAVTQGANGSVAVTAGGAAVTYTPAAGFFGTDTFTYTVTDEHGGAATATVTVTVAEPNQPPTAVDDDYGVTPGNALHGNVLSNDADGNGDALTAAVQAGPQHGAVTLDANGSFTYTPGPTFAGADSFTYTVSDGHGGTATATVTVTGRPADPGFQAVLSEGHADVGIAYEDDAFEPHIHDEENDVEYAPEEAAYHVRPQGASQRPAGTAFDFVGVPAGAPYYRLSQTEVGGLLYLGFGSEELEPGVFGGDRVSLRLKAVDGPGQLSVWENTDSGPDVLFATSDGITPADTISLLAGGHFHANWGFSQRGLYAVTVQFFGTLADGTPVESEDATYYFVVDPANPPPALTAPAAVTAPGGGVAAFTGANAVSVADANPGGGTYRVELAATDGTVTVPATAGVTVSAGTGTNDTLLVIEGNLAAVNAALAGLTFAPAPGFAGSATLTVTVTDPGDLVGAENAEAATRTVAVTVARPVVRVERVRDAAEPGTAGVFRLTRTGDVSAPLTVAYAVAGTATAGADYAALGGTVTFAAGAATADVVVAPADDAAAERTETVVVTLLPSAAYDVAGGAATLALADNDRRPEPIAVGTATGGTARLVGGGGLLKVVLPYGTGYTGEVRVATGDVTGDGVPDLITGTGPGAPPHVKVFDAVTGAEVLSVFAFEASFTGGVFVAAGDLDGDGRAEVIVSPDQSGGPRVVVFAPGGRQLASFFGIDDANFRGGVRLAVGDVNGDGTPDVVAAAGFGGGPRIAVFDGGTVTTTPTRLVNDFFAFEPALRNGAFAAAGDMNGDGVDDLAFGAGPGGAPRVLVFDGAALAAGRVVALADLFAGDAASRAGVRVAAPDTDADGRAELVAGSAGDGTVSVYRVTDAGVSLSSETEWFTDSLGVYVG